MIGMILAAGRGERLRPLTDEVPKSLVEIGGQTLLELHLMRLRDAGIRDVVINLGWLGEQIVDRIGSGSQYGMTVLYSDEREHVLETGGGIQRALPMLGDAPFLVINADIYTDMELPKTSLSDHDLGHLMLVPNPDYRDGGDFDCCDGRIRNSEAASHTFSGIAVYHPKFLADEAPGRFSLAPLLRRAADADRLAGQVYEGLWLDIGTPQRLDNARRIAASR